jgi:hypothetical protein
LAEAEAVMRTGFSAALCRSDLWSSGGTASKVETVVGAMCGLALPMKVVDDERM